MGYGDMKEEEIMKKAKGELLVALMGVSAIAAIVVVVMVVIGVMMWYAYAANSLEGNISEYAQGELTIEKDCWSDKTVMVNGVVLPDKCYYKVSECVDCDECVTRETLIEGNDYTIYKKTSKVFNMHSYFVECIK